MEKNQVEYLPKLAFKSCQPKMGSAEFACTLLTPVKKSSAGTDVFQFSTLALKYPLAIYVKGKEIITKCAT